MHVSGGSLLTSRHTTHAAPNPSPQSTRSISCTNGALVFSHRPMRTFPPRTTRHGPALPPTTRLPSSPHRPRPLPQRDDRISCRMQLVMWWSGLRGAISFALAITLDDTRVDHQVRLSRTLPHPHWASRCGFLGWGMSLTHHGAVVSMPGLSVEHGSKRKIWCATVSQPRISSGDVGVLGLLGKPWLSPFRGQSRDLNRFRRRNKGVWAPNGRVRSANVA
jgi:hypothetical protein